MTEKYTRIALRGTRVRLLEHGERTVDEMHRALRHLAEVQRAEAEAVLTADPEDFDVDVVRGSVIQRHMKRVGP